jgi:O-antigen/teichoic acid export membrane protein
MTEAWRRIASTSGSKLYSALLGVLTLSITARYLGPEGRGQVATIMTWVGLFAIFGSLSLGQIAIHRASGGTAQESTWLQTAFRVLFSMTVLAALAGWSIAAVLHTTTNAFGSLGWNLLLLGFLLLPPMLWEQYGGSLLMAREQLHIGNLAMVVGRTLSALLVIALVAHATWGVQGVIVATLVGQSVSSAWTFLFLSGPARPLRLPGVDEIRGYVSDGLKLHLTAIGAFLTSGMDVLMVGYFRGSAETGFYQLGVQLTLMMLIVPQATAMVAYGVVSRSGARVGWPQHRRLVWQTLLVMALAGMIFGVTAPWWLPLLAGTEFLPAIEIFRWQLLGIVGSTLSIVMAPQWIARGYFWQASMLTLAVGAANFVGNLLLIPQFGMHGAVWSSLACSVLAIVGNGCIAMMCEAESRKVR